MSKTPDYVLEAQFKTMLRKAHMFDWLAERMTYMQVQPVTANLLDPKTTLGLEEWWSPSDIDESLNFEAISLFDFCNDGLSKDPAFQFLKD